MCDELACRISGCSERTGKLVAQDNPETTVIPTDFDDNEQITWDRAMKFAAKLRAKIRKPSRTFSIDQTMLQCGYHDEDSISRHSTKRNWTNWEAHVESVVYFEITQHPKWKDGSVETQKSVQLWRSESVITKAVAESRSWSNPYLVMELVHG